MTTGAPLTLYGTRGCHLCDEAEALLRTASVTAGVTWSYVDIAEDDVLMARYAERIPVLRLRDTELGWPFGLLDVLRLVRGASD